MAPTVMPRICGTALLIWLLSGSFEVVHAQSAPLTEVNSRTEVSSIGFRFVDSQTLSPSSLRDQIWHNEPGALAGIRRLLGALPLIPPLPPHPFSPIELARDEVRLERYYQRNGFLYPEVEWLVRLDSARNRVRILFTIHEGPPLVIQSLEYEGPNGGPARDLIAQDIQDEWEEFKDRARLESGERLDEFRLIQLEEQALSWMLNRGYPFAEVDSRTRVDSLANKAWVTVVMEPGPRAVIDEIIVEGNESVPDRIVLRELPFGVGDQFSQRLLTIGQREVFELNIFTIALADVPEQEPDSLVTVRIRVRERALRGLTAQSGYLSEAGVTGQAEWTHRNFLGEARTFRASVIGNTGFAALVDNPDRRYRASLSLRQPYVLDRRLSATGTVFAERRDDYRDASRSFGGEAGLLYERRAYQTASASFLFEDRRVSQFRFGTGTDTTQVSLVETQLNVASSASRNLSRSVLSLNAIHGDVDDAISPRRGFVVRPAVQVALPFPRGALQYGRASVSGSAYLPATSRLTFTGRAGIGRLFPFVEEPETPGEAFTQLLRLRDVVFLAGGPTDVRGWSPGTLGPKVVDLIEDTTADEITFYARRYFPYGGLMRATLSGEGRFDLSERLGVFGFVDAGRVWTPDDTYDLPEQVPVFDSAFGNVERIFVGAGGGVSISSPVGAIQLALGFKVNPSFFDVRNPDDIAEAFESVFRQNPEPTFAELEAAIRQVEPSVWRRMHLHISIGQTF